jgi:hypothetical protein
MSCPALPHDGGIKGFDGPHQGIRHFAVDEGQIAESAVRACFAM